MTVTTNFSMMRPCFTGYPFQGKECSSFHDHLVKYLDMLRSTYRCWEFKVDTGMVITGA